jgi:hypothetical protein
MELGYFSLLTVRFRYRPETSSFPKFLFISRIALESLQFTVRGSGMSLARSNGLGIENGKALLAARNHGNGHRE